MIAEDGEFNVSAILASMGDLSQERIIAKHAARQSLVSPHKKLQPMPLNSYLNAEIEYHSCVTLLPQGFKHRRRRTKFVVRTAQLCC